ncbi:OmpA family protein [Ferruginivarius sediminum]|uniref:OmpA family protein n=1 Tax=Ferruginivarius sediminum TaxID=2661937 RepID=UPI00137A53F0|nr:OmpA family protein [Ferruginivarius sediminum]
MQDVDPTGLLGGDDSISDTQVVEAPDSEASAYPSISSVEEEPPRRPSRSDSRRELQAQLASDRANARYSGDDLRAEPPPAPDVASSEGRESSEGGEPEPPKAVKVEETGSARAQRTQTASAAPSSAGTGDSGMSATELPGEEAAGGDMETSPASVERRDIPQLAPSRDGQPVEVVAPSAERSRAGGAPQSAQATTTVGTGMKDARRASSRMISGGGERIAVVYFRHGSHRLGSIDRQVLRKVAALYREQGGHLRIVGHASSRTATLDPIAHRVANLDVSLKRAETVADALIGMNVPRQDIRVEARANRDPVYHEFMPTGEAGNRRAEVYLER